jgi:chromosome segregation ATPase
LTGNLSFSGLKSDVLNQACTEKGQKNNLPQYTAFLTKRDQAQRALDLASGEIVVLNKKIVEHKNTIEKKQAQIAEKNSKIDEITAYIEKSCKRPQGVKAIELCQKKKQQKRDLSQDVQILNNSIAIVKNTINQLSQKIQINQKTISQQIQQIARFNLFIKQYEACDRQLKTKPTLTSPSMSGEAMIS